VRTYSGNTSTVYGPYSNTAFAITASYSLRYVSPSGNDANDGTSGDAKHAWRTLAHGSASLACGQVLLVRGGNYANDSINMAQTCSVTNKAVILAEPASNAILTSSAGSSPPLSLSGSYLVVDGLASTAISAGARTYAWSVSGNHVALLG
jgi:hypothetical protein